MKQREELGDVPADGKVLNIYSVVNKYFFNFSSVVRPVFLI